MFNIPSVHIISEADVLSACDEHCDLLGDQAETCKSKCGQCVKFAEEGGDIVKNCQESSCGQYTGAQKDLCNDACVECNKFAKE